MTDEEKTPRKVNIQLIGDHNSDGTMTPVYAIAEDLIAKHHPALADGRLAILWNTGWKPDPDGKLKLGQAHKASDAERELSGFDFSIQLNYGVWNQVSFTPLQQRALIDHELCHLDMVVDKDGEGVVDERGRQCYRVVKHDLEEFRAIVDRYGCWTAGIEEFARAALKKLQDCVLGPQQFVPHNGPAEQP